MNKVTTINLGGNPYQLEEKAYEALQAYLHQAEANLAGNPDKEEVMHDFEQAVADKCEQHLHANKKVITQKDMAEILDAMGPVEVDGADEKPAAVQPAEPTRRLYLLPDEAMIGGVCAGLGAYFRVDVTVVRLLFVLLAFLTGGFWVLVYLLMMIIVPAAKTPEEIAAAHGETFNAQQLIGKAKQKYANMRVGDNVKNSLESARPALSNVGHAIQRIARLVAFAASVATVAAIAALTVGWGVAMWALLFNGYHLPQQLHSVSTLSMIVAAISAYYLVLLPLILLTYVFQRIARSASGGLSKQRLWAFLVAAAVWLVALSTLIAVGISNRQPIRDYVNAHPRAAYMNCNEPLLLDTNGQPDSMSCGCVKDQPYGPALWRCY